MATPLFSQQSRRPPGTSTMSKPGTTSLIPGSLLEFRAGRLYRDGESNWVKPDPRKGLCYIKKGTDGLLRFCWKDLAANVVEEELIVFPGDVTLEKVRQSAGRVYVLKFRTSSRRCFFWMQAEKEEEDKEVVRSANNLLNIGIEEEEDDEDMMQDNEDESDEEEEAVAVAERTPAALARSVSREAEVLSHHREQSALASETTGLQSTLSSAQVGGVPGGNLRRVSQQQPGDDVTPMGSGGLSSGGGGRMGAEELNNLRQLLSGISVPPPSEGFASQQRGLQQGGLQLGDVLTVDNLATVLGDQQMRQALFPTLPEGMVGDRASVEQVLRSPQFQQALAGLSQALASGQLAPLVGQLGLAPEAGNSVEAFLVAIEKQVEKERKEQEDREDADWDTNMDA
ncbi:hypothetical protein LPJ66_006441 [Kickxella alabastrina]|uniref:Uncharacterized protein n=1 Tax=Kickxella alabastrina TaxID=61397 RepID=A0ACC1IFG2_9FUNG|nr:hypothetical protein LPJ66_006441 [Kickxella alabastrina]